jgi:hypothetical protein
MKIAFAAAHFYGFRVALTGQWNTWVNRACSAVRYPDSLRVAQLLTLGGLALSASSALPCSGSAEYSLSTEVSRNVVVLDL